MKYLLKLTHFSSSFIFKGINYDILVESNFLLDIGNENGNMVRLEHIRMLGREKFEDMKNYHFG